MCRTVAAEKRGRFVEVDGFAQRSRKVRAKYFMNEKFFAEQKGSRRVRGSINLQDVKTKEDALGRGRTRKGLQRLFAEVFFASSESTTA